jgi:alkanesulfonate monooxygenase SsuD/methylene tetrahydromethanopterin reductase-like flavin-dependent oxidoreductase (luciferase family)
MDESIRFGVLLPTGKAQWGQEADPRGLVDFAVRAEALGYASVWANDSVLSPRIETLVMLAAVAPLTTQVTLGTATLLPVLRRPVQAAQALASLDLLSGGRLAVGVGAGFPGRHGVPLHTLSEVPWPGRFARLDDTVALWRQLWASPGPSEFHGKVLHFDELPQGLAPYRPAGPPILLGGATPTALARTGRLYDGWLPYPPDPAEYRTGLLAVRQAAADAGRDPSAITPALFVTVLITDEVDGGRRALDEYSRANYGLALDALQSVQAVIAGPPARVTSWLGRYIAAGARHILCRIGALDLSAQLDQLERIAELSEGIRDAPAPDMRR